MEYLSGLTIAEKETLCDIITGAEFKKLFITNEQEFQQMHGGFRAKALSESLALSIAKAHVNHPFITSWINDFVNDALQTITENISALDEEGATHLYAIANALYGSIFADQVDLYFKLTGETKKESVRLRLDEMLKNLAFEQRRADSSAANLKDMKNENAALRQRIEADKQALQQLSEGKESLEKQLAEAKAKLTEQQARSTDQDDNRAADLELFDDTDFSALPASSDDQTYSLCGIVEDVTGQKWLERYADLHYDRTYQTFYQRDDIPPRFENRSKLYIKDGPNQLDFYGVWSWRAIQNENDPQKDYITTAYQPHLVPIEVYIRKEAATLDDLVALLKKGLPWQLHSLKIMFAVPTSKKHYTGILCQKKDLYIDGDRVFIAENCDEIPVYEFPKTNLLRLKNGLTFYKEAFAGRSSSFHPLKSDLEIVRRIVADSISWSAYRARGLTRQAHQTAKTLFATLPLDDATSKIEEKLHCSKAQAETWLTVFRKTAENYIDKTTLEDDILRAAVDANSDLQKRMKDLVQTEWAEENKQLLDEAKEALTAIEDKRKVVADELETTKKSLAKAKVEKQKFVDTLATKEQVAANVEKEVRNKIQKARENAAEFIAHMAFITPLTVSKPPENEESIKNNSDAAIMPYHIIPTQKELTELAENHNWDDVLFAVAANLDEAGVTEQHQKGLAAFLCAAYIEKQPLFLAGANAIDIVQAFSAAVQAKQHGVLSCRDMYCQQAVAEIGTHDEKIVLIQNLLASNWMNHLPEILARKDMFYVATHPYAEDLQVEPQSLYGFMLPLFTEFFVDKKATGGYYGSYFAADFTKYKSPSASSKKSSMLVQSPAGHFIKQFPVSPLIKNQISHLLDTMHGIDAETTVDDDFLFAILPLAYTLQKIDILTTAITNPQDKISISSGLKRELQYLLGDF